MAKKPTYEELERKVKELEKVADKCMRTEKVFQASDQEKEAILNSLMEHVIHQDTEMRILWANRAACESVNLAYEKLVGRFCYEVWQQRSDLCPDCPVKKAMETGQSQEIEKTTLDGRCWLIRGYPLKDSNGNIKGGIEVTLEVTERKKAEAALRESEEKFRFLAEKMVDIIWIIDRDFQTTYVSPSIENVLGFTPEERKRQSLEEMITPESLQKVQAMFIEELQRNEEGTVDPDRSVIIEVEYYHKKGSTVWVENIVKAIRGPGGAIVGMHGVSRDINERKQAEEALKEREVELARKNLRLEELNSALKILLEKRDQDKTELEDKILININELILPYVEKLKKAGLSDKQEVFADILQSNLEDIVSPFARKLKSKYLGFTPTELKVANLVKQGLNTKEIADLLNSSPETISGHRKSMRKKLKLTDKKSNLRTHLLSLNNG